MLSCCFGEKHYHCFYLQRSPVVRGLVVPVPLRHFGVLCKIFCGTLLNWFALNTRRNTSLDYWTMNMTQEIKRTRNQGLYKVSLQYNEENFAQKQPIPICTVISDKFITYTFESVQITTNIYNIHKLATRTLKSNAILPPELLNAFLVTMTRAHLFCSKRKIHHEMNLGECSFSPCPTPNL